MKKSSAKNAGKTLLKIDAAARDAVRPYRETLPVRALSGFGTLGDQPPMLALSGLVLVVGAGRGDRRMFRAGVRMIAAHLLATLAKNLVKRRVDRSRPRDQSRGPKPKPGRSRAKAMTSFPSGHSAGAIAVASAFAREYPAARVPVLGAAGAIAVAQIPSRSHYLTDVVAGIAIGALAAALVGTLLPPAPTTTESEEGLPPA